MKTTLIPLALTTILAAIALADERARYASSRPVGVNWSGSF
jgi:hypothetical protein